MFILEETLAQLLQKCLDPYCSNLTTTALVSKFLHIREHKQNWTVSTIWLLLITMRLIASFL
jgi:hypothetical protein